MKNAVALSLGATFDWRLSVGSKEPPPTVVNLERSKYDLSLIHNELWMFLKKLVPETSISMALVQAEPAVAALKVLISPETDAGMQALMQNQVFRQAIYGQFWLRLERSCKNHGYQWLGYVMRSTESVKHRFKGDWEIYNDWMNSPTSRPGYTPPAKMLAYDRAVVREVNGYQELFVVDDVFLLERSLCEEKAPGDDACPLLFVMAQISDHRHGEWRVAISFENDYLPCRKVFPDQAAAEEYSRQLLQMGQEIEAENTRRQQKKTPKEIYDIVKTVVLVVALILLWQFSKWLKH